MSVVLAKNKPNFLFERLMSQPTNFPFEAVFSMHFIKLRMTIKKSTGINYLICVVLNIVRFVKIRHLDTLFFTHQ